MNIWQLMNSIILNLINFLFFYFFNIIVIMSAFATPLEDPTLSSPACYNSRVRLGPVLLK